MKLYIHSDRKDMHVAASLYIAAGQIQGLYLTSADEADLVLNVDSIHNSGMIRGKKTAYWELDDNLHQGKNQEWYNVDLLYIVSKDNLSLYPSHAKALPVAMEPTIHYDWGFPKDYDMVFIASLTSDPSYAYRKQVVDELGKHVALYVGTCQPQNYPKILSQGKLLLNVMPRINDNPPLIITRFYESMGIGCLIQDYDKSLDELATRDVHYIGFDSIDEAIEKAQFYLKREDLRIKIAQNARANVLAKHTWKHRLETIIKDYETIS